MPVVTSVGRRPIGSNTKGPEPMSDDDRTAVPGTGPQTYTLEQMLRSAAEVDATCFLPAILAELSTLNISAKRIADALKAGPTLRDQMAMAIVARDRCTLMESYDAADHVLAFRAACQQGKGE